MAIPIAALGSGIFGGGGGGGFMSALSGLGKFLPGLGGLFGYGQSQKFFEQGRDDIRDLPGMQGPMNLGGSFGSSINGIFMPGGGIAQAEGLLGQQLGGMFGLPDFSRLQPQAQYADQALQGTVGPESAALFAAAPGLMSGGAANLAAAGDSSALQQAELDIMRQRFAPEAQRTRNQMMDRLHSMGLLGAGTNTQSQSGIVRGTEEALAGQDLDFQREAFARGLQRQQFLGNLGMQQIGQGAGLIGQGFGQNLQAMSQNQQAALQRLQAAQGLFGQEQDIFAQRQGLGLQGIESMLGLSRFGLDASALPFQLQAGLLGASGHHANALGDIAKAQADAASGFFGGLFG